MARWHTWCYVKLAKVKRFTLGQVDMKRCLHIAGRKNLTGITLLTGAFVSVLFCMQSFSHGGSIWLHGGNTVVALEQATGMSSGGLEQEVDWKDSQFKSTALDQAGGVREEIGVIQCQAVPPLDGHVLFSLNDLFGITDNRISPSAVVDEAWLWVYVTQVCGDQTITIRGIQADDREWSEVSASFVCKQEQDDSAWTGGELSGALNDTYGVFENPTTKGWYKIPVNLSQALMDYRDGVIGGIVFEALSLPSEAINNFYFCSNENSDTAKRPGLYVVFSDADDVPTMNVCELSGAEDGAVSLDVTGAAAIFLNGQPASYDFGGAWSVECPLAEDGESITHELMMVNEQGAETKHILNVSGYVAVDHLSVNPAAGTMAIVWQGHDDAHYTMMHCSDLGIR